MAQAGLELAAILLPQLLPEGWGPLPAPGPAPSEPSSTHVSAFVPRRLASRWGGDPRRAARGERWAPAAAPTRPRAPLPAGAPGGGSPRPHTAAPTSAARRGRGARPHSLTHSPWPRGRDALSRVAAFLCAAPRAARASHSPPPPRAARLPAPSGARRARPAPGRFLRPAPLALGGSETGAAPPEACARPRSAPDAAPPAGRAGMCKPG